MNDFATTPYLMNCLGRLVKTERVLRNKETFIYLFASSHCTGDKELLQKFRIVYREIKKRKIPMEIFYISSDRDPDVMLAYFRQFHHGWYAIPVDTPTIGELQMQYNVTYEPQIIVVSRDGSIVTKNGRAELEEYGNNVIIKWRASNVEY